MTLHLRQPEHEPQRDDDRAGDRSQSASGGSPMPPGDIDRWLGAFSALLRLPEAQRRAITDELEDHLRSRAHDLMVAGAPEHEAVRRSIEELGEAAELATRFRHATDGTARRRIMSMGILGISAAALTLSVVAISGGALGTGQQQSSGVVFREIQPAATSASLDDVRLKLGLEETPIGELFALVGKMAELPVFVHWDELPLTEEDTVTLQLGEVALPTALRFVNMRFGFADSDDAISYRVHDGVLEFADRDYFDRREAELLRYDLSDALVNATPEDIEGLIYNFVEPNSWEANGGVVASLHIVGESMFVRAPKRLLPKLEWILAQLAGEDSADEEDEAAALPPAEVRVLAIMHTRADDVAGAIEAMLDVDAVRIAVDERSNVLIVHADKVWQERIAQLVAALDREVEPKRGADATGLTPISISAEGGKVIVRWDEAGGQQAGQIEAASVQLLGRIERLQADDARIGAEVPLLGGIPIVGHLFKEGAPSADLYIVREGDSLASIAREALGSADRWSEILECNPGVDPRQLEPGQALRLPK
ncbi:MAG: permease prefix domain 1-containing protein [Phycisphaerales bacterium JB039]